MASNALVGILQRLEMVECSSRYWKLISVIGWSAVAICIFAAADDGEDNARPNRVVDTLNTREVLASSYNLVLDGRHYGGLTIGKRPDGNSYPVLELRNGHASIFAEAVEDSIIVGISGQNDSQPVSLRVTKDQTYLQLSAPGGPIGLRLLASKEHGGGVMLVDSKGEIEYVTPKKAR